MRGFYESSGQSFLTDNSFQRGAFSALVSWRSKSRSFSSTIICLMNFEVKWDFGGMWALALCIMSMKVSVFGILA